MDQQAAGTGRDLARLVERAFARARDSGKADWSRMTLAVLKNRLLQLTGGAFSESQFGASDMRALVRTVLSLQLDESLRDATVRFVGTLPPVADEARSGELASWLRPDLWRGVMDYSSGARYCWDTVAQSARQIEDGENADHVLPTVSAEVVRSWMRAFIDGIVAELGEGDRLLLESWYTHRGQSRLLPGYLRRRWNGTLIERARVRLSEWFQERALEPPLDLVTPASRRVHADGTGIPVGDLRQRLLGLIGRMSDSELERVMIPASCLRVLSSGEGRAPRGN